MKSTTHQRSNRARTLGCVVVAFAFMFLGIDGYHTGWNVTMPGGHGDYLGDLPFINWTHGWPFYFYVRPSIYPLASGPGLPPPPSIIGDVGTYSRWPIDNAPVSFFHPHVLALDIGILTCLLAGAWFGIGRWSALRMQFGTRSLLILSTLAALLMAFRVPVHQPRYLYQMLAYAIVAAAVVISVAFMIRTTLAFVRPRFDLLPNCAASRDGG